MKKNFKLVLALLLAAMMIVGSFSAIAATANPHDTNISITGLDEGDKVNLYQVLRWEAGTGWVLTDNFKAVAADDGEGIAARDALSTTAINKILAPATSDANPYPLEKADLEAITNYVKTNGIAPTTSIVVSEGETSITYDIDTDAKAGLYLALVEPKKAGIVYNPIVVSADYENNDTNSIDSSETMGTSAVAKKKDVTVVKTEPKITNEVKGTYSYTITTNIPMFAESFQNPYFTVSDTMSDYLVVQGETIKLYIDDVVQTTLPDGVTKTVDQDGHSFTFNFAETYINSMQAAVGIKITYDAKLTVSEDEKETFLASLKNVHEEDNEVTVEFPNNPKDDNDATVLVDDTREYTFTIDGLLFGDSGEYTNELVKVGLNKDGTPLESMVSEYLGRTPHAALDGAVFGVYANKADAEAGNANYYTNDVFTGTVTTANDGRMVIPGLDAGVVYYVKELSAPAGYIKDQNVHTIYIQANISEGYATDDGNVGQKVTKYYKMVFNSATNKYEVDWKDSQAEGYREVSYYVPVLISYTVIIDGTETSGYKEGGTSTLYTFNQGPEAKVSSVTARTSDTEIVNTKGVELPSTGGIGTTIFYIGGSILVLAAAILLITKRRMGAED